MTAQVDWAKTGIPLLSLASFRSLMLLVDLHHRRSRKFWNEAIYSLKTRSTTSHRWYPNDAILAVSAASLLELGGLGEIRHHSWSTLHPCVDEVHLYPRVLAVHRFWWGPSQKKSRIKNHASHNIECLAQMVDFKLLNWQTAFVASRSSCCCSDIQILFQLHGRRGLSQELVSWPKQGGTYFSTLCSDRQRSKALLIGKRAQSSTKSPFSQFIGPHTHTHSDKHLPWWSSNLQVLACLFCSRFLESGKAMLGLLRRSLRISSNCSYLPSPPFQSPSDHELYSMLLLSYHHLIIASQIRPSFDSFLAEGLCVLFGHGSVCCL